MTMPRVVAGPMWLEEQRLAGYAALALAEAAHDRVRLRKLLAQLAAGPPQGIAVPDAADAVRDLDTAVSRVRRSSRDARRGELLHLLAFEGLERHAAADRLFLSERQFYRVRQEAAAELAEELTALWRGRHGTAARAGGPRTAREQLPLAASFVGRRAELEEAAQQLRHHGILLLGGPPGIGKTALAAQVVAIESNRFSTAWHRFRRGLSDSPASVLLSLAGALTTSGDDRLERHMAQAQGRGLWLHSAVDLAKRCLGETPWLLWFDDTDVIVENEPVCGLLQLLFEECADVRVLLTGRAELWRLRDVRSLLLSGLCREDVVGLIGSLGVADLGDTAIDRLIDATGGSPQLLRLAANVLAHAPRPDVTVAALVDEPDVSGFLLHHVFSRLREDEVGILGGASLLRSAVTAGFLARAFGDLSDSVPDALVRLSQQFLLAGAEGGLRLHSSLRQFCQHQLSQERRNDLHRHLAAAYASDGNVLEAAYHWSEAGLLREARDALITGHWRSLPVDQLEAVAQLSGRLITVAEAPGDDLLRLHVDVLRALGRSGPALEVLSRYSASLRAGDLLVIFGTLAREHGDVDAARSTLSRAVGHAVPRRDRWRVWWELARTEALAGASAAARRAAARALETATDDDRMPARLGALAIEMMPTDDRLSSGASTVPLLDAATMDEALDLGFADVGGITSLLTLAAASASLPSTAALLRGLRTAAASDARLQVDLWTVEGVQAAATGDYHKAAQSMWRAAERGAAVGRNGAASIAAATAAIYRLMHGEVGAAQSHLDWAAAQAPGIADRIAEMATGVRWLRSRNGPPPTLAVCGGPAIEATRLLLGAVAGGADATAVRAAVVAGAGTAADYRMVILDLALDLASDAEWEAERRALRLGAALPRG
ncbi:MAG: hypothetical protein ACYDAC_06265 [Candidatus Dormibacteria bacterium]